MTFSDLRSEEHFFEEALLPPAASSASGLALGRLSPVPSGHFIMLRAGAFGGTTARGVVDFKALGRACGAWRCYTNCANAEHSSSWTSMDFCYTAIGQRLGEPVRPRAPRRCSSGTKPVCVEQESWAKPGKTGWY